MRLIDTHCHLYLEDFDPEQDELAQKAKDSGIDTLLLPNVDLTTIDRMHDLCDRYPEFAFPMMGLHPTSVDSNYIDILKQTESYLSKRTYCGIGEIGIDLYWDKTYLKEQQIVFEEQLRWSIDLNLPVAIHTRDAYPEVLECIHKVGAERLKGVFHSFTGTTEELEENARIMKNNGYYSAPKSVFFGNDGNDIPRYNASNCTLYYNSCNLLRRKICTVEVKANTHHTHTGTNRESFLTSSFTVSDS